jgi:hypothetical protein
MDYTNILLKITMQAQRCWLDHLSVTPVTLNIKSQEIKGHTVTLTLQIAKSNNI